MAQKSSTRKPAKPYKEFPLFAHSNGQWAKKIRGKLWYFGKWEDGHEEALRCYLDEIDEIQAGRDPRATGVVEVSDGLGLADLLNLYLTDLEERRLRNEVTARHFADCQRSCKRMVERFGRRVLASSLRATDFTSLRNSLPRDWAPNKTGNEIARMKAAFRWAAESELIPGLPNFGPSFKKPTKREVRRAKQQREAEHGKLDFTAEEAWRLVEFGVVELGVVEQERGCVAAQSSGIPDVGIGERQRRGKAGQVLRSGPELVRGGRRAEDRGFDSE